MGSRKHGSCPLCLIAAQPVERPPRSGRTSVRAAKVLFRVRLIGLESDLLSIQLRSS